MRLTKKQEVRATNELLTLLAKDRQNGGSGLRTSHMRGTAAFHGSYTLSLTQIARLLRKTGKATPELLLDDLLGRVGVNHLPEA